MGQPILENQTPFQAEVLYLADEDGRNLLIVVVKATYTIAASGKLKLAEEQVPVNLTGAYWGEPEHSSYKYEPECAFVKPATDVVLIGSAYAPRPGVSEVLVMLCVGALRKEVRVVGDRVWVKGLWGISMTRPLSFEKLPLVYERAFGGWDRSHPDPAQHTFEPRNPVGTGYRSSPLHFEEELRLPNLEDPEHGVKEFGRSVPPTGFGFMSPHWQPRTAFAGTYDEVWSRERMPLLPKDFDRRYFNAASPGLIAPGYLRGDEDVTILNASPEGKLAFSLPETAPPTIQVERSQGSTLVVSRLDTVIFDMEERRLQLLWRGNLLLEGEPHQLRSVMVRMQ